MRRKIEPDGRVERVSPEDRRLGLKIIDIKSSGEASPGHFAELAYYGMALAEWLDVHGFSDTHFVLADAAIWSGKHEASAILKAENEDKKPGAVRRPTSEYLEAFESDLEVMPPEVVCNRVARFFSKDIPAVLAAATWDALPGHVAHRCQGCDYLGFRWSQQGQSDPRYCWPSAEQGSHLSRIAGLTEGACGKLREEGIDDLAALAAVLPGNPVFESHHRLRATRTVVQERARVLVASAPAVIPDRAGTSAILPRHADIRVAISADYDIGSGVTFAFGYRTLYFVNREGKVEVRGKARPLLVERKSLEEEGVIFCEWLRLLVQDVQEASNDLTTNVGSLFPGRTEPTIQFFAWDRLTLDHLCRVMGRHLPLIQAAEGKARATVGYTTWMFPSDRTLESADFVGKKSPITVVADAIGALVAAPIPHHYSLVEMANTFPPDRGGRDWNYQINRFYLDPLSDQIPPERGHEIWTRGSPFKSGDYQEHRDRVRKIVGDKLSAVLDVVRRLTEDLSDTLTAEAPPLSQVMQPPDAISRAPMDGQIIFQHSRLLAATQRLENSLLMAMPPHEREARFLSIRVEKVEEGDARARILRDNGLPGPISNPAVLALRASQRSRDAKFKEGEYHASFMSEADLARLGDMSVWAFKKQFPAIQRNHPTQGLDLHRALRVEARVTILKIDRANNVLVVEAVPFLADCFSLGLLDTRFDPAERKFGIIDPVVIDYFTKPLGVALSAIGAPPASRARPLFSGPAIARVQQRNPRAAATNPAEAFIWEADTVARLPGYADRATVETVLDGAFSGLTPRQREAVVAAATGRLTLWWGPPGTGKSATAVALIVSLFKVASAAGRRLRLAVTGPTWVAIDNVLKKLPGMLEQQGLNGVTVSRLGSSVGDPPADAVLASLLVRAKSAEFTALGNRLDLPGVLEIVGTTADQMAKLQGPGLLSLFDVMLIDEASQMDVAHAIVAYTKLASDCSVVVVGDDKQMPPVHAVEPPVGAEHLLGSIYDFYAKYRNATSPPMPRVMLNRSFRSNREIVEFVREAGYGDDLESEFPNLRIAMDDPPGRPIGWPAQLPWSPEYDGILVESEPLVAVINFDAFSSQRNEQEADLVAALVRQLYGRGLKNLDRGNDARYGPSDFFQNGVGIVTPHRAQQAAVLDRLFAHMPSEIPRGDIYGAVDTVERFQGQQRAVMFASFGLGDPDQIGAEEEFLFSLNRFNVIASRARAKLVVLASRRLIDHLPREREILVQSRLLKHYVDGFLRRSVQADLLGFADPCELKFR